MNLRLNYKNIKRSSNLSDFVKSIADNLIGFQESNGKSELHATFYKNDDLFTWNFDYFTKEHHYHESHDGKDPYRTAYYGIKNLSTKIKNLEGDILQ